PLSTYLSYSVGLQKKYGDPCGKRRDVNNRHQGNGELQRISYSIYSGKNRKGKRMDLIKKLEEFRTQEQALTWEGTFADYFEVVKTNPSAAQLAHARVFDMIMAAGAEPTKMGT